MALIAVKPSSVSNCTTSAGDAALPCEQDSTIVEFRPKLSYLGEFGFDWLRVKEAPTSGFAERVPYIDNPNEIGSGCVIGGYKDLTALEAQAKIKKEYIQFTINRPKTNFRHLTYYVPYLNLYPKNGLNFKFRLLAGVTPALPPPPHTAELRMMIDIKGAAPEKIEIEFDPKYFEINDKSYITVDGKSEPYKYRIGPINYTPTPDNNNTSRDVGASGSIMAIAATNTAITLGVAKAIPVDILKIACLNEFDTDQYINVYAYPAGSSMKSKKEQMQTRKLAGQLIVCANSKPNRRVQKIVLVRVRTNLESTPTGEKIGTFDSEEMHHLYKVLYQALIFPDIFPRDLEDPIILDMSKDEEFNYTKNKCGKYVDPLNPSKLIRASGDAGIPAYLRRKFLAMEANKKYEDCLTVFSLGVEENTAVGEAVLDSNHNFVKNVATYGKYKATLAHEVVHGLGVYHAHVNEGLQKPDQKYFFPQSFGPGPVLGLFADEKYKRATSNIMGYRMEGEKYSTWRWQWLIMKRNTSVEP